MSQKVNAISFRRSLKSYEWDYKYTQLNKEEYSSILYKNVEIKKYLHNLFKYYGFLLVTLKIELFKSNCIIHISFLKDSQKEKLYLNSKNFISKFINKFLITTLSSYHNKNIGITVKLKDLNKEFEDNIVKFKHNRLEYKKIFKQLKSLKNYPSSPYLIKLVLIIITNKKSAKLLSEIISHLISTQKKRHSNILMFFKKSLTISLNSRLSAISGIKILISGRINGFPRAKKRLLKLGSLPLQSIKSYVDYYESTSYTLNGTFGIKVWIC